MGEHVPKFALLALMMISAGALSFAQTRTAVAAATQSNRLADQPPSTGRVLTRPIVIGDRNCTYPPIARQLNQEGTTVVKVHVTATGAVADAVLKASSGHQALDTAAVACAKEWTFRPGTKNETPIEAYSEQSIQWSLTAVAASPVPFLPPGPPSGWEPESSPHPPEILVSYKLSGQATAEQYLSAAAYPKFSDLVDFVSRSDNNLQSIKTLNVLKEEPTTICGSDPASELEYSQFGLIAADRDRALDVEQVRTVKNGWAYVTTYIRPADSLKRADAEQWIHAWCQSQG